MRRLVLFLALAATLHAPILRAQSPE